jgi:2',3'-cyclic-nucleotide 2'-phosphodiesterase
MRLLYLGDVMGRAGRQAVSETLPRLRAEWAVDFVVVNGENATSGAGLSKPHAEALLAAGADVVTLGDHAFDQRDMMQFIEAEPRILRPLNFAKAAPGKGARVFRLPAGARFLWRRCWGRSS